MSLNSELVSSLFHVVWLVPLLGALAITIARGKEEKFLAKLVSLVSLLSGVVSLLCIGTWLLGHGENLIFRTLLVPRWVPGHFEVQMRMDAVAAVFCGLTSFFQWIIIRFSRVYLHREDGYHRFFALIFLLTTGMQLLSLADNLEVFFVGWEFIGLASFFLVAFYRQQKQSATNALKIISIYRIGDLGLVLAMVVFHLLPSIHPGTRLSEIHGIDMASVSASPQLLVLFFGLIIAAAAKSAQFPFTFWLPKAMEGPTPSSAIFYGALSVHAGALLLIRLFDLWSGVAFIKVAVATIGLLTIIFGVGSGRVQTSIKGQLAYASAVQVGFVFVELAFGFKFLAIFHIASHALYRSLQLIVSPSIITHTMVMQSQERSLGRGAGLSIEYLFPAKLRASLYVLAIQENFLEHLITRVIVSPVKKSTSNSMAILVLYIAIAGLAVLGYFGLGAKDATVCAVLAVSLLTSVRAAAEKSSPLIASRNLTFAFCLLALSFWGVATAHERGELVMLLLLMAPFAASIEIMLRQLGCIQLAGYSGLFSSDSRSAWGLFLAVGALIGIPPLPGFFFEDLLLAGFLRVGIIPTILAGLTLAVLGIAGLRLSGLITMGPSQGYVLGHRRKTHVSLGNLSQLS